MFEEKRKSGFWKIFLTSVATSLGIAFLLFFFISGYISKSTPSPKTPPAPQNQGGAVPQPQLLSMDINGTASNIAAVAKSATPGVVGITVVKVDTGALFGKTSETTGVGSGVIVSPNGYILTNNHVAGGKNKSITVSLLDGRNIDGVTVWADPVLDLAVVKISASNLPTIPLGDANALQVGETAIAIGNPLGLQFQRTVTSGIISALNRTIEIDTPQGTNYMEDLIQTDASINPGNSGGPLLNSKGQVVGINTIKVSSAEAMGFAIPINAAAPIIKQLEEKGEFIEPYMGIFAYDKEVIPFMNNSLKIDKGIYVAKIDKKGPAYKAGLRLGCIITQVDGHDMTTMMQLRSYLYSKNPGDTINITHISNGRTMTVPVKLMAKVKDGMVTR